MLHISYNSIQRPQGKKMRKQLDVSKLKQDSKRHAIINDICSRLDELEHNSEDLDEN